MIFFTEIYRQRKRSKSKVKVQERKSDDQESNLSESVAGIATGGKSSQENKSD